MRATLLSAAALAIPLAAAGTAAARPYGDPEGQPPTGCTVTGTTSFGKGIRVTRTGRFTLPNTHVGSIETPCHATARARGNDVSALGRLTVEPGDTRDVRLRLTRHDELPCRVVIRLTLAADGVPSETLSWRTRLLPPKR